MPILTLHDSDMATCVHPKFLKHSLFNQQFIDRKLTEKLRSA